MNNKTLFIISGKRYEITCLNDKLDDCFKNLYSAWLGSGSLNYDYFKKCVINFLDLNPENWSKHNNYFENFTIIWHKLLGEGKHAEAQKLWQISLEPVFEWERNNKSKLIHKGTAYYFYGVSSLLQGEIDKSYSLMHQALEEDVRINNSSKPNTPAFNFVSLNFQELKQYLINWLFKQIDFLNIFIVNYKKKYNSQFSLELFRNNFLKNQPDRVLLFLFSYTLTRFYLLHDIPEYALKNNFSGQIELNSLFDLSLVVDGSIKAKNSSKWKFIDHASFLNSKRKLGMNKDRLRKINKLQNTNFDGTIENLVSSNLNISNLQIDGLRKDLAITYCIRNRGAHSVSSSPIIWKQFREIEESLFNTLFWVVEDLYQ